MLDRRHIIVWLTFGAALLGQDAPPVEPPVSPQMVQSAAAQVSRFERYTNPAVSTHAIASLAAQVCEHDPNTGSGLFRRAMARLNDTSDSLFVDEQSPVLPISSFTGLWKMVTSAAVKCDPTLAALVDVERVKVRMATERQQANTSVLPKATLRIAADPERAAQLADLVLTVSDTEALDFTSLGRFMAQLRERAPELGDRTFTKAVNTLASAASPSTPALDELGKYLFVNVSLRDRPDELNLFTSMSVQSSTVTNFSSTRYSTNPEVVEAYVGAILKIAQKPNYVANYDATVLYVVASQTEPRAREMQLETRDLSAIMTRIATSAGLQIRSGPGVDVPVDTPEVRRQRAAGEVLTAVRGKRFSEARQSLTRVDDEEARGQLETLIKFGEAAQVVAAGDAVEGSRLSNAVRPGGLKRGLLYAGIVAGGGDISRSVIGLALEDAKVLPAEFRAAVLIALADALIKTDPERSYSVFRTIVEALNAARASPRQARFDPRQSRNPGKQGVGAATDIPYIPLSTSRFYEVVDVRGSRHSFDLGVPNVNVFTLPSLLLRSEKLDYRRLEATVLDLRGEKEQAAALLALVESRLKP